MSTKPLPQPFSGDPQLTQRAQNRRVIREELGACVGCGVSLAKHFSIENHFLPCGDPRVTAARHEAVSE